MATSGWFWTNRPELINVVKCNKDGTETEALDDNDPDRILYIDTFNRQDMVMNRLNNYKQYEHDLARMLHKSEIKRIEKKISNKRLRLPG